MDARDVILAVCWFLMGAILTAVIGHDYWIVQPKREACEASGNAWVGKCVAPPLEKN